MSETRDGRVVRRRFTEPVLDSGGRDPVRPVEEAGSGAGSRRSPLRRTATASLVVTKA